MFMNDPILSYFPGLSPLQYDRFRRLEVLYREWNARINVVSRKDIENLNLHHVLYSLGIARVISFVPGTRVMDAGTGGGFPGIPLAILFPDAEFTLVDSIAKKIRVVEEIRKELGLDNVYPIRGRVEEIPGEYDFITGRAVTALPELIGWLEDKISPVRKNTLENGILYLKGGDFEEELKSVRLRYRIFELSSFFPDPFFETKKLVHICR
jgi:16S rRNA (guanine527-N7)-methyltransferase